MKQFIILYNPKLDDGSSGFVMHFKDSQYFDNRNNIKSRLSYKELVNQKREDELRSKIKTLNLKTGKWFSKSEFNLPIWFLRVMLGCTVTHKIIRKIKQ